MPNITFHENALLKLKNFLETLHVSTYSEAD